MCNLIIRFGVLDSNINIIVIIMDAATVKIEEGKKPILVRHILEPNILPEDTIQGNYYIGIHRNKNSNYITIFKQGHCQINLTLKTYSKGPQLYMQGDLDCDIYKASDGCKMLLDRCHRIVDYIDVVTSDHLGDYFLEPKYLKDLDFYHREDNTIKARLGLDQQEVVKIPHRFLPIVEEYQKVTFKPESEDIIEPKDYWKDIECIDIDIDKYKFYKSQKHLKHDKKESKNTGSLEQRESKRGGTVKARSKRSRATVKSGSVPGGKGPTRS